MFTRMAPGLYRAKQDGEYKELAKSFGLPEAAEEIHPVCMLLEKGSYFNPKDLGEDT
jgi:hypothetical protein